MTEMPQAWIEIALTRDSQGNPLWHDVSPWVEWQEGVTISRRRSHELDEVQPGTMSVAFDNSDGRFTSGRAVSPYYPNVKINRMIRLRARWPSSPNLLLRAQGRSTDAGQFSATSGGLGTSTTAPPGQTSAIRWAAASWSDGELLRIGSKSTATATEQAFHVIPGTAYAVSCQARRETNSVSVALYLRWFNAAGVLVTDTSGTSVVLTTSYQSVSVTASAPAGAAFARVVMRVMGAATDAAILTSAWQVEQAAAPTAWKSPGEEYRRFTGFVDRWPSGWTNGVLGTTRISATDRHKLLSRGRIRQAIKQVMLATKPVAYWPCGEPPGSTLAANAAASSQPYMRVRRAGSNGSAEFGVLQGPDGTTGVQLTPVDTNNGRYLLAQGLTTPIGGTPGISVSLWVISSGALAGEQRLLYLDNGSDDVHLRVNYNQSTTTLSVGVRTPNGIGTGSTNAVNLGDGFLHHVVVTVLFRGAGQGITTRGYIDGIERIFTATSPPGAAWPPLTRVFAGGYPGTVDDPRQFLQGTVSHIAAWNTIITAQQAAAMAEVTYGYHAEMPGPRAARIAGWGGITRTRMDVGSVQLAAHPHAEQTPLTALKQIALSEAGLFFIDGDDAAVFHGRLRREAASAPSIVLTADQLGPDLQFTTDDQLLINDITITRTGPDMPPTRAVDTDSVDEHGEYPERFDTLLINEEDATYRADHTLRTYSDPQPRAGQVSVPAHNLASVWPQMLGSDIGQHIRITDLPSQAPGPFVDLWCEGVEDQITDSTWTFRLDTSPRQPPTLILDDPLAGTLDYNALGW
ncbi:hypothetical protein ACFWYW_14630 [Nonomuraea sp. NPDC059023]|uniref:hypothetical protein n=1 Tax=unclassified Nonomuraea TaxID=2593643 RepID=UPI0036A1D19C